MEENTLNSSRKLTGPLDPHHSLNDRLPTRSIAPARPDRLIDRKSENPSLAAGSVQQRAAARMVHRTLQSGCRPFFLWLLRSMAADGAPQARALLTHSLGRAWCRERVGTYVYNSEVAV